LAQAISAQKQQFHVPSCFVKYISAMQLALSSALNNEIACQVAEALVLIVGVILGWLVWPAISQTSAHRALLRKEKALLQESTTFVAGIIEDVECEAEDDEQDLFRADHLNVVALLDHYDLFGGYLGVSSSPIRSQEIDLEDRNLEDRNLEDRNLEDRNLEDRHLEDLNLEDLNLEETTENWAFVGDSPETMSSKVGRNVPTSITDKLFEHYGLFGASAGAWSG